MATKAAWQPRAAHLATGELGEAADAHERRVAHQALHAVDRRAAAPARRSARAPRQPPRGLAACGQRALALAKAWGCCQAAE